MRNRGGNEIVNRRHFFKSLAAVAGATSVSPLIFIPKFEPVKWKRAALTRQMLDEIVAAFDPALPGTDKSIMTWKSEDFTGTWRWVSSGDVPITDLIAPQMGVASDTVECGYECRDGNYKIVTEEVKFTTPGGDVMFLHVDHDADKFTIGRI